MGWSVAVGAQFQQAYPLIISGAVRYNFDFSDVGKAESGALNYKSNAYYIWGDVGFAFGPRSAGQ